MANSPQSRCGVIPRHFFVKLERIGPAKEEPLARKTVLVCDNCGKEVGDNKGATLRLTYSDARRGAKQADLCDDCAGGLPGHAVARRGRKPKAVAA
jgi:hypothetical protein